MASYPCNNANCARAGWCKGFTYKWPPDVIRKYRTCSPDNQWMYYTKNKAREIYERDNPDDILQNEEPDNREHEDNNREPGLRENDEVDTGTSRTGVSWRPVDLDNLLFPHGSSDTRSPAEVLGYITECGRRIEGQSIINGGDERRVSSTDAVLQDTALSSVPSTTSGSEVTDFAQTFIEFLSGYGVHLDISRAQHSDSGETQNTDEG